MRNLERELEWVRGEREEERTAVAHERRETAARLKEAETASSRLKSSRRDDLKRVTRERAQALERCKVRCNPPRSKDATVERSRAADSAQRTPYVATRIASSAASTESRKQWTLVTSA